MLSKQITYTQITAITIKTKIINILDRKVKNHSRKKKLAL